MVAVVDERPQRSPAPPPGSEGGGGPNRTCATPLAQIATRATRRGPLPEGGDGARRRRGAAVLLGPLSQGCAGLYAVP